MRILTCLNFERNLTLYLPNSFDLCLKYTGHSTVPAFHRASQFFDQTKLPMSTDPLKIAGYIVTGSASTL